jgi:hypothetical protein
MDQGALARAKQMVLQGRQGNEPVFDRGIGEDDDHALVSFIAR